MVIIKIVLEAAEVTSLHPIEPHGNVLIAHDPVVNSKVVTVKVR